MAENLVIIGAGAAGYTAAIYAARANLNPVIVAGGLPGGQLTQTTEVENYPGFRGGILGFDLMESMRQQAERFQCRILYASVTDVAFGNGGIHQLTLDSGDQLQAHAVIICTGAAPRWLELESETALKTKGVSSCATCDGAFFRNVPICVVGGGDTAMEEALFLTRYASQVIIVHRRDRFRASRIMADRVLQHPKISVRWDSAVAEILDARENKVTGVILQNVKSGETARVDCAAVFVAIGHIPATAPFRTTIKMDEDGYIITAPHSSRTNIDGVFAAGDCVDRVYRQAVTAAGMGCQAAIDAIRWLEARHS